MHHPKKTHHYDLTAVLTDMVPRNHFKVSTCIQVTLLLFMVLFISRYHDKETAIQEDGFSSGSWQRVLEINDYKFLVYSAYLDIRTDRKIVIIAVTKTLKEAFDPPPVWCRFFYGATSKTVSAEYEIIEENWNLDYSPYYIICPVESGETVPQHISVVANRTIEQPSNLMKVTINSFKWNPDHIATTPTFAVCVKPIHFDYDKVMELLEFIELYRLMGVTHFFLYNHTIGPHLNCILRNYEKDKVTTILPWQLPIESQKEIRTEGIFAALNDCLYRTMHRFSHTIFVDFDEFIVPRNGGDYGELLGNLSGSASKSVLSFRNAFFYRQWPDDTDVIGPVEKQLVVLTKTRRRTFLHPMRTRSKYFVRPELVNMVGNHFVWKYHDRQRYGNLDVDPKDAILHHYRECEYGGDDCVNHSSIVDKTAYQYREELVNRVKLRYDELLTSCQLPKLD